MRKLIVIALDGYELSLANAMMDVGQLPSLASIREKSARYLLDHGSARQTGLAGEHVSSGLSPKDAERWSAIFFDKENYEVWQEGPLLAPFPAEMRAQTVVFDLPYFDLSRAGQVHGVVSWGVHDPGTEVMANPVSLLDELVDKYGAYPATEWIYGIPWPSSERCQRMGNGLAEGASVRAKIALWLLTERFPDWQLALIGVSESHSALEGLWHGIDERHPLHSHSSSVAAAQGVHKVYQAIDGLVGTLATKFADATILLFSMHGMGPNRADVPAMVLLPELLHRYAFGRSFFVQPDSWTFAVGGVPILGENEDWNVATLKSRRERIRAQVAPLLPEYLKGTLKRMLRAKNGGFVTGGSELLSRRRRSLEWMPAAFCRSRWSQMPAFALPSYYDGRIRINLKGRERKGVVELSRYKSCCDELMRTLELCRDPFSGDCVVDDIEWPGRDEPLDLPPSGADLIVNWRGSPLCMEHPDLGRMGPVPFRRTGGHSGLYGIAYLKSDILAPGDYGIRSSFDVVPTLFDLLNERLPSKISGQSLIRN